MARRYRLHGAMNGRVDCQSTAFRDAPEHPALRAEVD